MENVIKIKLPSEVLNDLPNEEFKKYSKIIDFLNNENWYFSQSLIEIDKLRKLTYKLDLINEAGELLQLSPYFNAEKMKLKKKVNFFNSKSNSFELIKTRIEENFNFIKENPKRTEIFPDKFNIILKHIADYQRIFPGKEVEDSINTLGQLSIEKNPNLMFEGKEVAASEPANAIPSQRSRFDAFCENYYPGVMNRSMNSGFSHEFFNFKKNNDYVNYKILSGMNNLHTPTNRSFFFGRNLYYLGY